jgi:hypothetical protein
VKRNEKRMQELQQHILKLTEKQERVLVLTDSNAWIGESPSILGEGEDGLVFPRTSERPEINKQGEWFLTNMNSVDMLVLNGLKERAVCTYEHPSREATSVIDFICVNSGAFEVTSDIIYQDKRLELETDHIMLTIEVEGEVGKRTEIRKKPCKE